LKIPKSELERILAHARRGHPFEVCGVLLGQAQGEELAVQVALAVENREVEMPRVRYLIAPEDLLRIQRESREAGRDIIGYYHSHPDHPARPSETDRRIAAGGLSDGVAHMVIGVTGAGETTPSAWIFRDASQSFDVEPLLVTED
jgi:proteasome lid subunit RPN8/RPN11